MANMTLMDSEECVMIVPLDSEGKETNLAMTVSKVDKYAPKKTGVYNVALMTKDPAEVAQQWKYDRKSKAFFSRQHEKSAIFEGYNKNVFAFKYSAMKNQQFLYDEGSSTLFNFFTENAI